VIASGATGTAVERFAHLRDAGDVPVGEPRYRELLPLSRPGPGEQYAFEVDLDACTGCKACVVACRSLNGLDADESWRTVAVLTGADPAGAALQTVTASCHHCVEPACLAGCPVDAYEKDPATGIVVHLDDQCIGCRYCTLTCPYEVPRYSASRGIVRKCDMCRDRLAAGEPPACAQACPNGAIRVTVTPVAAAVAAASDPAAVLVPGAPPSALTLPTTRYRTGRDLGGLAAAEATDAEPADPHPPLVVMLVLTQLAVGTLTTGLALDVTGRTAGRPGTGVLAAAAGLLALAASVAHLGRPRYAFRAVLGLRHSWLSREIAAFGAFVALAPAYAAVRWAGATLPDAAATAVGAAAATAGIAGVTCSAMVYAVTGRPWWRLGRVAVSFATATSSTGASVVLATAGGTGRPAAALAAVVTVATLAGLVADTVTLGRARRPGHELAGAARLLRSDLARLRRARVAAGLTGGVVLPAAAVAAGGGWAGAAAAALGAATLTVATFCERLLFFRAAVDRPGVPR
jgi:Fe-S-cluster-containing dehydrogenase component/DMSO reductase anchor subunit